VLVFRDVTEQKRAEHELREADRRKDEFLAMLAHELRNPLAAIGSAVEVVKGAGWDDTPGWAHDVIERQVRHLARLVDDLLDVSRVSRGKIELRPRVLELATVLDGAVQAVRPLADERGHALDASYPAEGLRVKGDPTRLEQVVVNLLTNAIKYTESGGRIALSAGRDGQSVVVSVRDSGIGIPPEQISRMFDLFAQGDRSLARSEGGLGIGLTLLKALTEMHGGHVAARSEGRGRGSEFSVTLPATDEPADRQDSSPSPGLSAAGARRILVVDDNVDTANGMSRLLTRLGQHVHTAHDGPSALDEARMFQPEFVLLDIGLPGMDGYQVARRMRETGRTDAVIIAVSGYGREEDRRRSKDAGIDHHLVKPVDVEALVALIGRSD
jgi:CheY-like chemotaxis protein